MDIVNVKAGQVVSFKLQTKLLKDLYTTVKVVALAGYSVASIFEDVAAIHANILADLPEGTPKSPEEYNYLIVDLIDGTRKCVGLPWILGDVELVEGLTVVATITNGSMDTADIVTRALNAYGISGFTVEVKQTTM